MLNASGKPGLAKVATRLLRRAGIDVVAFGNAPDSLGALALSRALRAVEQAWRGGEADPGPLARRGLDVLRAPGVAPEYLALVDEQMRPVARVDARTVVLVAAKVGKTRLIDNVVLGEGVASDTSVRA